MKFKQLTKKDYMGFAWFGAYLNGEKVIMQGTHLQYHASDEDMATRMHIQTICTRLKLERK